MLIALLALLCLAILAYGFALARAAIAKRVAPGLEALALGAVVNFLDTLGIGRLKLQRMEFDPYIAFARIP